MAEIFAAKSDSSAGEVWPGKVKGKKCVYKWTGLLAVMPLFIGISPT